MLGRAYERGWGVKRNAAKAAKLFQRAAEAGDAWARFNLADLFYLGDGVDPDRARACALYAEAARGGILPALNMLGILHEEGYGSHAPDPVAARLFYRAAARQGDGNAKRNLMRLEASCADAREEAFGTCARAAV
ncbi:hypothetical protein AA21291_0295 [Swaminathania salitolerans LMG 21291]|uniref:Sel1 repeat family protein n=2 Tax=Swaminathania salitolerans TaxID=182838 RepID=A0A511BNB9_9PROT|nr:tetratricopeptide repeat protein [Swaminathania salitolerans]GBQ10071.1 hypothetical protein AA21291_0295 [Swaminathania salitolerans LMG 21291]GEL01154.1 hypothetical protein SSA02_03170 [Swaminathania salitolerans]